MSVPFSTVLHVTTPTGSEAPAPPSVGAFWAKSDAGGRPNLLVQHLLDTAAVGELVWDRFLAPTVKSSWDRAVGGRGRELFTVLCAVHDVGKASPAFQSKVPHLAARVQASGLTWRPLSRAEASWHHTLAGAKIMRDQARRLAWDPETIRWFWPFVAGHHGKVPGPSRLTPPGTGACHGTGPEWSSAQGAVLREVAHHLEVELTDLANLRAAGRAVQLALLGALIMADWVASNADHFPGVDIEDDISLDLARERATAGWAALGLRGGWDPAALPVTQDPIPARFGLTSRPGQAAVIRLADQLPVPGLLIVEAPMGEGKTEAALAAVEVLSRRFGSDGLFVGMPTQATSDPMFARVQRWAGQVDPTVPLALLHGKARFNPQWREMLRAGADLAGVDDFGLDDPYGIPSPREPRGQVPAEWFLGSKRGLLTPVVVGTVDQLLHAATRTRHVMLRHAGLTGKVVLLDEVHAYDVYMTQFLHEALRWLAQAGVPVVVLSATLPPAMRTGLAEAYLQGALTTRDVDLPDLPKAGYPCVTSVCAPNGVPLVQNSAAPAWRPSLQVSVELLPEPEVASPEPIVDRLCELLTQGGCALVVHNTVARAQDTYRLAREALGTDDVILLHGRLTAGERADRTQRVLSLLGPPGPDSPARPRRLVVVATQLAEQSFDVDVDVLITDLAPIDLVLQRAGRLHRHERPGDQRPALLRAPRLIVTGIRTVDESAPSPAGGSAAVYGEHLLLRSASLVLDAVAGNGWSIPGDVPSLVEDGYADDMATPSSWAAAVASARQKQLDSHASRRARAQEFLLSGPDRLGEPTLAGLHERSVADLDDDDAVRAVVRDGDPSVEVILVGRDTTGNWTMLDGRPLGVTGEAVTDPEVLELLVRDTVRLPARPDLTAAALAELGPLDGWRHDPWLARARALELDSSLRAHLGGWDLAYDHDLGLTVRRQGRR